MKIINKLTGEEKKLETYKSIIKYILAPIREEYTFVSDIMQELLDKYKNEKLVKFVPDRHQIRRMVLNPECILDMPRYYVKGYDKAVTSDGFDAKISREFYRKFMQEDLDLIKFINKYHPTLKIIMED